MMTITITTDVTATLSLKKVSQWVSANRATENRKAAWGNESLDWEDFEDLWNEEDEAWERFFS